MTEVNHAPRGVKLVLAVVGIAAVAIVVTGFMSRSADSEEVEQWTQERLLPTVAVTAPENKQNTMPLKLAGRLEAFKQASIYARVDGYVAEWHYDIGSSVSKGDVLAVLDTPELDEQLMQAEADLARADADLELADATVSRWRKLIATKAVTAQDVENRENTFRAAQAQKSSAEANFRRLQVQKDLAKIIAPFDGVVTMRNKDIGDLINAGADNSMPIFQVVQNQPLRLNVNVPQKYIRQLSFEQAASIEVPELPGKAFPAEVARTNMAVDTQTGTTIVQLMVDNQGGNLLPGGFASVELPLTGESNVLTIPASALIFNADGLSVATVTAENKLEVKPVKLSRDLGREVEILSGLSADDKIVMNPPDGAQTGQAVRVIAGS